MTQVVVPWQSLSGDALDGVITEFVSREGTEYGEREVSLQEKIDAVKHQLRDGTAVIVFDEALETCNIIPEDQLRDA